MGLGGINIWQLLIILVIVLLLFGTKKLRNLGSDLGGAIRGFKDSMGDDKKKADAQHRERILEGDAPEDQAADDASKARDKETNS